MKEKFLSIKWEIMAIMLLLVLAVIAGLGFSIVRLQTNSLTAEVEKRGQGTAAAIAGNIADMLLIKYDLEAAKLLKEAASDKTVAYAMVVDNTGKIIAHNDMTLVKSKYAPCCKVSLTAGGNTIYETKDKKKIIDFTAAAAAKGRVEIGTVHVGISYGVIDDAVKQTYLNIVLVTLCAALMSVLAAFFLSGLITKPINALADGAKIIGSGDLNYRIKLKKGNELGVLGAAFNIMTEDLKTAQNAALERRVLEKELEIAGKIQVALLPKTFPGMAGYDVSAFYKPAKEIGGDYYDVIPLGQGRFGIVIADVSGKGIPEALVMTMLSGILNIEARVNAEPAAVISALNDELLARVTDGMFATVFYGVLDTGKNSFDMVSAGHHETFIYNDAVKKVLEYCPRGVAVGLFDGKVLNSKIEKKTAIINPGDKILLFTDGISDAKASSGVRFGIERVSAALERNGKKTGKEVLDALRFEIESFTHTMEQTDDIARLIIDRKK